MPPDHRTEQSIAGRTVGRLLASMRQAERLDHARYNGGKPIRPRDQRGDRHSVPIQATGSEDGTNPGLWPAKVRYWSGYSAGVHTFADQPGVPACWAFPAPGGDDLTNTGEYLGLFVGMHTDGLAMFEVVPVGGGGSGLTVNLQTNSCPVFDGSGLMIGTRVEYTPITFPPGVTVGTPFCVTNAATCDCTFVWGDCCEGGVALPDAVFFNTVNIVGFFADCLPNTVTIPVTEATIGNNGALLTPASGGPCDFSGASWDPPTAQNPRFRLAFACNPGAGWRAEVYLYPIANFNWTGGLITVTDLQNGWQMLETGFPPVQYAYKDYDCEDEFLADGPEAVGTWTATWNTMSAHPDETSSFDLVLSK